MNVEILEVLYCEVQSSVSLYIYFISKGGGKEGEEF